MIRFKILRLVIAVATIASASAAGNSNTAFQQDLIHVRYPIHVEVETVLEEPRGNAPTPPRKAVIPTRVALRSNVLRAAFDVSEYLRQNGLTLPPGSYALYSPGEELLFLSSTADDLELTRAILSPFPADGRALWFSELRVTIESQRGGKKEILNFRSVPLISGQRIECCVTGDITLDLALEPVVGPDAEAMDVGLEAKAGKSGKSLAINSTWHTHRSQPDTITLGKLGDADVVLHLKSRRERDYWGPGVLATPKGKAAAIKEIQADLKPAP